MKNILKVLFICALLTSCEETESPLFDGTTGVGFGVEVFEVAVPEGGITVSIPVVSTTASSQERTFEAYAVVVNEETDLSLSDYTIGAVTVPADSYEGTVEVTFNYDGLEDFTPYTLGLALEVPGGGSAFPPVRVDILKEFDITEFVCADLTLTLVEDAYADERDWDIKDSSGAIVAQCSDYAACPGGQPSGSLDPTTYNYNIPTLAAGEYTLTVYDSYGDGMFDGNIEGNYNLYCAAQSVVSYASGGGNFGDSDSTTFTIVE